MALYNYSKEEFVEWLASQKKEFYEILNYSDHIIKIMHVLCLAL
jgi:hypothetical protein